MVTNMGEVGYLDYKGNPRAYVYAKVLDGLTKAKLALEMLSKGFASECRCEGIHEH